MKKLNAVFLAFVLVMPLLVSTVIVVDSHGKNPIVVIANAAEEEQNEENETEETPVFLYGFLNNPRLCFVANPNTLPKLLERNNMVNSTCKEVLSPPPELV